VVVPHDLHVRLAPYQCLFDAKAELGDLLATFGATEANAFLEIGTNRGASSAAVALCFPQARVVTLDLPDSLRTQWNPLPRSEVGEAHRALGVAHRIEQRFMDSSDLWRLAGQGEVYDLVFIDGDHSPEPVFRDLILAADMVPRTNGVLLVHDYTDVGEPNRPSWTLGVQAAVDRFLAVRPFRKRRLSGLLLALELGRPPR
jgi:predicted O-methyltransferase YrrM